MNILGLFMTVGDIGPSRPYMDVTNPSSSWASWGGSLDPYTSAPCLSMLDIVTCYKNDE
jgi:hypothetical protein